MPKMKNQGPAQLSKGEARAASEETDETREATPTSWGTNKRGWRALVVGTGDGAE